MRRHLRRRLRRHTVGGLLVVVLLATVGADPADAAEPVGLGTAAKFAVLGGSTVTNTGATVITGDVGVSPGTAVTGFPPGEVREGTIHADDEVAKQAQTDVTTAYNDAAGRPATPVEDDLGGKTLPPGVYRSDAGMGITGTVTLDGQGDPASVFVFQAGSTLITATSSVVALVGKAHPCNVFWQVGSSATLATDSTFAGTVMALSSVTVQSGAVVQGRVFARNAAVTLDTNRVTRPTCEPAEATTSSTTAAGGGSGGNGGGSAGGDGAGAGSGTGNGTSNGTGNGTRNDGGKGTGNGTGSGSTGSGTNPAMTPTTRPGASLIPPAHLTRRLPRTGTAVIPMVALGIWLVVLGTLLREGGRQWDA